MKIKINLNEPHIFCIKIIVDKGYWIEWVGSDQCGIYDSQPNYFLETIMEHKIIPHWVMTNKHVERRDYNG